MSGSFRKSVTDCRGSRNLSTQLVFLTQSGSYHHLVLLGQLIVPDPDLGSNGTIYLSMRSSVMQVSREDEQTCSITFGYCQIRFSIALGKGIDRSSRLRLLSILLMVR